MARLLCFVGLHRWVTRPGMWTPNWVGTTRRIVGTEMCARRGCLERRRFHREWTPKAGVW